MAQNNKGPEPREARKGGTRKDIAFCSRCGIVYFKKSWHHNLRHYQGLEKDAPLAFVLCPACKMASARQYQGELIIERIIPAKKEMLMYAIRNAGIQAYRRDPLNRVLWIEEETYSVKLYTSESHLAVGIAKKLRRAFKGSLRIIYRKGEQEATAHLIL